jgi:two-component system, cell cycle sensor histidine kinase and response regulator CckA
VRILVVDDSGTTRDRLEEALSKLPGVEHVHRVASALEAIRAIYSGWPDTVIFDINLPRASGPRVLEALRTGSARILRVVLTNDATPECREACLRAGADFFFDKSREFQSAIDVIARLARGDAHSVALPPCWNCFDQLPIPSWLYDVDTFTIRAVNHAAIGRYGYSRDEFLAMTFADIQVSEARVEKGEIAGRRQHRDRDGGVLHVEVAVTPLNHDGRRLSVALAHDISARIVAEQALRESQNRHRELEQRLGQRMDVMGRLGGSVAHDLNNILTVIMGRSQEMIDSLSPDHPARAEAVAILDASGVLAKEIRQALDAGRAKSTKSRRTPYFISPPGER